LEEEFGWRGYALDRLQAHYSALLSSVFLGIVWGLWHLPLFFMSGQDIYHSVPIPAFILGTIFLSILFTWIYNNTGRSILAVLIFQHDGESISFYLPRNGNISWGFIFRDNQHSCCNNYFNYIRLKKNGS